MGSGGETGTPGISRMLLNLLQCSKDWERLLEEIMKVGHFKSTRKHQVGK